MFFVFAIFFISTFFTSHAWPTGAGSEACGNLTPLHHGIPPQNLPGNNYKFPYDITYRCRPDGSYEVLITGESFHGFLLQARLDLTKEAIGIFNVHPDHASKTKAKNCNPVVTDSLTHSSPEPKTSISGIWIPPEKMEAQFYFVGSVVKSFDTFWVNNTAKASFPCVSTPELPDKTSSNTSSPQTGSEISNQSTPLTSLSGGNQSVSGNESTITSLFQNQTALPESNVTLPNASVPILHFIPSLDGLANITTSPNSSTIETTGTQSTIAGSNSTDNIFTH